MQPAADVVVEKPEGMEARVLAEAGKTYAIYLHHGREVKGAKPRYQVDGRWRRERSGYVCRPVPTGGCGAIRRPGVS